MSAFDTVRDIAVRGQAYGPSNPSSRKVAAWFWLGLVALLVLGFFGGNLLKFTERWSKDPSYSHGFLVPFLSLWLAVHSYRRAKRPVRGDIRMGCLAIGVGAMLHLLLTILHNPILDFVAVGLTLWGVAVAVGGVTWARSFLFPIGFLFFLFPLPATWTNFAGVWLQDWVSQISAVLIDPFVVCYRRGHLLYLAGVPEPLAVAAECSGLRQILAFAALGVLVGGLSRKSLLFPFLLAAVAIPVALCANVARILLMAAGAVWFGTQWMGSWMHDVPALITLPLGLALFLMVVWGLNQLLASSERQLPERREAEPISDSYGPAIRGLQSATACLVAALLAEGGLTWYLHAGETPAYPQLRAPLAELPYELRSDAQLWRGRDISNLDEFRTKLPYPADDLLYRLYEPIDERMVSPSPDELSGETLFCSHPTVSPHSVVYLYLVYSRQGEDRKHHPEICIRDVSGAAEDFAARRQIALDAEGQRTVMRFRFRTGIGQFTTVYYWHYSLEAPQKGQTVLRRLYQQQNYPVPSVTVQVSLIGGGKGSEAVEKGFLAAVDSALRRTQLPATARIGCERLPIALIRK